MKKVISTSKEQFNLLRIIDNENHPEFFEVDGTKYILKIELDEGKSITLHDFIDLSLEENNLILEWRNNPEVRKWMYNQHIIKLEEHLNFIENLKINKDKLYFLLKKDGDNLGVIYFVDINSEFSYFGFYGNPNSVSGIGRVLEETSIKFAFDVLKVNRLKLEIFENNIKVINLHKKYKFKEVDRKIVNNINVICMELKNEDRKI
ncbi:MULTISPECIES: UDP-4-amino-4,6-dideoxy-N-acetyl-beta-L-altrosamine N-acetyltransferase [Arcobacteraceae]|uniref:UDP-4-amino-4,6-dideoxy-beta-L-AltNAc o-acetyltransferase n=2 Tax=Arcobacteraceae TaxID=2808963 RepID=A0A5C2HFF5_9BACT|nr:MULTISPECIES: UDP-4-amino-4,6-dideoxy-N-acetyl-beta-L-altrosamine N-acetyltransferase [Arcobacteraceae]OCL83440.1 UDP-4-amino-4,6-dideoxy-N-acetyl-beta-L-altrosamine N-acetyltransferase [Arcobacter porcinus]OCL94471.1 UDP-4-amino-4,6-dideoxy-N-acetyl-beta-L-altrosamine N-acetyltransferase [Aliarcobacter thereius]OCL95133.1 UDP-4-amino-4,6-dideoxy-N-acetyl-beta-L-altrosamine N-acetyltransferase [Aliarcobacter thereius LMG 24486]QBF16877.1 UDP-4-amino-4,6-dideoxy-beta-L-AltNAc o-acetyltransfer